MIRICFSLHDASGGYSKYAGTALCSLLDHAKAEVGIHLIHDETLSAENRQRFLDVANGHRQKIFFHEIPSSKFGQYSNLSGRFTIGTLFRLMIPDVLPESIHRLIYLDADILVKMDIQELWEFDLHGNVLAARRDVREERWLCDVLGAVSHEEYFNAGVLLLDLDEIRRNYRLLDQCLQFFQAYPDCQYADQDAMNTIFQGRVSWLPERCNCFTKVYRNLGISALEPAIYHFAGDQINLEEPEPFDYEFLAYLRKTPWGTPKELQTIFLKQIALAYQKNVAQQLFFKKVSNSEIKKIVFGVGSVLLDVLLGFVSLPHFPDCYVDNDKNLHGGSRKGIPIISPSQILLQPRGTYFIIILSQKYYQDIRQQLTDCGLCENEDFMDGRLLFTQRQGGYRSFS